MGFSTVAGLGDFFTRDDWVIFFTISDYGTEDNAVRFFTYVDQNRDLIVDEAEWGAVYLAIADFFDGVMYFNDFVWTIDAEIYPDDPFPRRIAKLMSEQRRVVRPALPENYKT